MSGRLERRGVGASRTIPDRRAPKTAAARPARGRLPRLFVISIAIAGLLAGFEAGLLFAQKKWFPYSLVGNAQKTATAILAQLSPPFAPEQFIDFSGGNIDDVQRNRISVRAAAPEAAPAEHFLMTGGVYQYLDYCPGFGCIAVEFTRTGSLVHAYPYRPESFAAHQTVSLPYEQIDFRPALNRYPMGLLKLPGGDLIATFQQWNTFPYGGGIARLRPNGSVVWFRHDYSHHWPKLLADGDIAVPAMRVGGSEFTVVGAHEVGVDVKCDGKIENDIVRILDQDGRVRQEISVLEALLHSPYRGLLLAPAVACAPLHLNYVAAVTPAIRALYGDVSADDLIVSLRDVNAFAILGRRDGRLEHLFTGTFLRQHSVQPLGRSATMLIFDNYGADWNSGPSRLLAYDLADHRERSLLPNVNAGGIDMFSDVGGNISVSTGFGRAIVASSWQGKAYEVRIADGKILTVFNDVHDLRNVPSAGPSRGRAAARFHLFGVYYVR